MNVTFEVFGWRVCLAVSAVRVPSLDDQVADAVRKISRLATN